MVLLLISAAMPVFGAESGETVAAGHHIVQNLTTTSFGYASLALFALAYILVMLEEVTHLRKSKPVLMAAGLIWVLRWTPLSRQFSG